MKLVEKWAPLLEKADEDCQEDLATIFEWEAEFLRQRFPYSNQTHDLAAHLNNPREGASQIAYIAFPILRRLFGGDMLDRSQWSVVDYSKGLVDDLDIPATSIPIAFDLVEQTMGNAFYTGMDRESEVVREYATQIGRYLLKRAPVVVGRRPLCPIWSGGYRWNFDMLIF